jgi:allantoin racemase
MTGVDVLVLGCMNMGFFDVAEQMTAQLAVPIISLSKASVTIAEAAVWPGPAHSRQAGRQPPNVAAGRKRLDLHIGDWR